MSIRCRTLGNGSPLASSAAVAYCVEDEIVKPEKTGPVFRTSRMKLFDEPPQFQTTYCVLSDVLAFTGVVGIESNRKVLFELFVASLMTHGVIVGPATASDFWMMTTFSCLYWAPEPH